MIIFWNKFNKKRKVPKKKNSMNEEYQYQIKNDVMINIKYWNEFNRMAVILRIFINN